jgi:transposase
MGHNFRPVERDQQYLMPPSLSDWLPPDHLAWVVLDAVDTMDLGPFLARYRDDGWGGAAYDPAMMTALLLYAYATGSRSSRHIERRCREDVACRVICANATPDHATIARFRAQHETALGGLFGEVLRLCAAAGIGRVGLVALDGTKLAAAASMSADRTADELDAAIAAMLAEAAAADAAEDAELGPDRRGDELPPAIAERGSRLARFAEARRQLAEQDRRWRGEPPADATAEVRQPSRHRPNRPGWAERNTTDPEARRMRTGDRWVTGYNAQVVVAEDGLVLATGLTDGAADTGQLGPMVEAAVGNVRSAGFGRRIGTLVADAGYWSEAGVAGHDRRAGPRLLVPPRARPRTAGSRRPPAVWQERMRRRLARPPDRDAARRRGGIVEPVFGQIKEGRGFRRFSRRGLRACTSEWSLMCSTHNLLKLWRHTLRQRGHPTG